MRNKSYQEYLEIIFWWIFPVTMRINFKYNSFFYLNCIATLLKRNLINDVNVRIFSFTILKWFIMYKMYYSYVSPKWYQRSLIGNEILLMIHALWFAEISNMPFYAFSCFMHISCFVLYCTIEISLNSVIAKGKNDVKPHFNHSTEALSLDTIQWGKEM